MNQFTCICGEKSERRPFSKNFDAHYCRTCESQSFAAREGLVAPKFQYDSSAAKYASTTYLQGSELRWAHKELLKFEWADLSVLEIGCFNGFFLSKLAGQGAAVYGFDVNEEAIRVGQSNFGLDGRMFSDMESVVKLGPFDRIVCIDVLEHIENPKEFITAVASYLKPNGQLIIAGPVIERGFHDKSDFPPHHSWWFSRAGLAKLMSINGMTIENELLQHDGLLLIRNFIGRCIHGLRDKEYYGTGIANVPDLSQGFTGKVYGAITNLSAKIMRTLGWLYCSTIIFSRRS